MTKGIKILKKVTVVLVFVGLLVAIGFALFNQNEQKISAFLVKVNTLNEDDFLSDQELKNIILSDLSPFIGKTCKDLDLAVIENIAKKQVAVKNASAFMSVDGRVFLEVELRTAIARIKPVTEEGFYIDSDGKVLSWVPSHTPKVLIITGRISKYPRNIGDTDSTMVSRKFLKDVHEFASVVHQDEFWSKQLVQVDINANGDAELISLLGNQKIIFGELNNAKHKLDKLLLFYNEIVSKTGWNKYQEVNLKFDKQIVCKK